VVRPAPIAFAAYVATAVLVGDCWPIARFDMYADLRGYDESAVIVFRADGRPVEIEQYEDFTDDTLAHAPDPRGVRYTMGWRLDETRRWVLTHKAPPGTAPGPVNVQVGYVTVRIDGGPHQVGDFVVLAEGRAWPRS
jgi:hypothetical protein